MEGCTSLSPFWLLTVAPGLRLLLRTQKRE